MPDLRKMLKKYYPVILLVLVVAVCIDLLSFSDVLTGPILEQRQQEEIIQKLEENFPDMTDIVVVDDVYVVLNEGGTLAYAFLATDMGYGGEIRALVILNDQDTVHSIYIVKHTETPGLGGRIETPEFTDQFEGISIEDIRLTTDGGAIDGITGATISSTTVTEMIREQALEQIGDLPSEEEIQAALQEKQQSG
jgi:Na+-translocating ferredoxin:NAD+ oxidoreductase subunit G